MAAEAPMDDFVVAGNLIEEAARFERRLIEEEETAEKRYRRAEEKLAKAELELEIARGRYERRVRRLAEAAAALKERQAARAAGPPQPWARPSGETGGAY